MEKFISKIVQVQFVIITCCLLGTVFSASLFGIAISAPKKVVKTGMEEIYQVLKPNMHTNSHFGYNNKSSNGYSNKTENSSPVGIVGDFKNKTQEPPKINKVTQDYNLISDSRIPIKKDSYDTEKVPETLKPENSNQNTGDTELVTNASTRSCSESGTDYTTETSEYETTTTYCESLNRIGAVSPNVVASLLG